MKLVFQIALGIIAVPFVVFALLAGTVMALANLEMVLLLAPMVVAGVLLQRKFPINRERKPVEYTYKGEIGS